MSKRLDDRIQPAISQHGRPTAFTWRGATFPIAEIMDFWEEVGRWWASEGTRRYYRVRTPDGKVFELEEEAAIGVWRLSRVVD